MRYCTCPRPFLFSLDSPIQYSRPTTISLAVLEISTIYLKCEGNKAFDKRLFLNTSGSAFFQLHLGPDMALMVTALVNTVPWKLSSQYANLMTRSVGRPYHDLLQSAFSGNPPQVEASAAEIWSPGIFQSRQPPVIIVVWFLAMLTSATPSTASCRSDVLSLLCP